MSNNVLKSEKPEMSREIVVPGEVLTEDPQMLPGRGAIKEGKNKIIAIFIGLKDIRGKFINVIPLQGIYTPEIGDKILAKIIDKTAVKWYVDINSKEDALLRPSDAMRERKSYGRKPMRPSREDKFKAMSMYKTGDIIICKIISCNRVSSPVLTTLGEGLGKINDGLCIQISVPKIPRIIGKKGSMIKLLKDLTSCRLFVSKNGRIWIRGTSFEHERLVIDAIHKIEREAHTSGLTDRIQHYIQELKIKRGIK
ncbi:MAG: exosome complex RNA-binding protein Rrp4 [Promethearchaeota archaeon]